MRGVGSMQVGLDPGVRGWQDVAVDAQRQAPIVWFRPSVRREVWRAWVIGFALIGVGATTLGALRVADVDFGSSWLPMWGAAILVVTAGPLVVFVRLQKALGVEKVLSVHADGLLWRDGEAQTFVAWGDLEGVEPDGLGVLLRGREAALRLPERFEGIDGARLVAMLEELQRKALLGVPLRAPDF